MAKELARRWEKFSILDEEGVGVDAIGGVMEVLESKGQSCLVGKLITKRIIRKESIRSTLIRGWRSTGSISFKVIGENLFLLDFEHYWDKSRVLEGCPWIFKGQLFVVEEFDG